MEEQIKALIEKYEKMEERNEYAATDDYSMGYNDGAMKIIVKAISDLKKLLEPPF